MKQEINVGLIGNETTRRGVYANSLNVVMSPKDAYIDFAFLDGTVVEDGGMKIHEGMHQARIIVSHSTLKELRDLLNDIVSENED